MEIQFDDKPESGKTPKTRLYAPGKKAEARAQEKSRKARQAAETVVDEDGFRIRVEEKEVKVASRVGLMFSGFLFAGMVLFTLSGYERIARAYADINTINNEIETTRLRIAELDVALECAVTIQEAQEAAEAYGMRYPTQDQYARIGSYIPISGTVTTASTDSQPVDPAADDQPTDDSAIPDDGDGEDGGGEGGA